MNDKIQSSVQRKIKKVLEVPNCSICLEPMMSNLAVFTECGHVFHDPCATSANTQSRKCPNCRQRSVGIKELHFRVEEIDGVEQQMQNMLQQLSDNEQLVVADLMQKYEDSVTEMHKAIQKLKYFEEQNKKNDEKNKILEIENQKNQDKIKLLLARKEQLKIENIALTSQLQNIQTQNEQDCNQLQALKKQLLQYEYLKKIQEIIQDNDDAQLKMIKHQFPVQRQVQEISDLFKLKDSQLKGIQQELLSLQEQLEGMEKKFRKQKSLNEDLQKENTQLREFSKFRKLERSHENSMNQIEIINNQKQRELDHEINAIADPYSFLKKRKIQEKIHEQKKGPIFGKNSLLNLQGFHNSLSSFKQNNH